MDINTFLTDNASAIIGLIGVVIGAILTSIPIIFIQLLQRYWDIKDDRKHWRRESLLKRFSPIQNWLDTTLRFTEAFEQWFNDNNNGNQSSNFIDVVDDELRHFYTEHRNDDAIVYSHALSTGDEELLGLLRGFRSIRTRYSEELSTYDNDRITANRLALDAVASKLARRLEYLLEQAHPIGGPYHDKSIFNFRRKFSTKKKERD